MTSLLAWWGGWLATPAGLKEPAGVSLQKQEPGLYKLPDRFVRAPSRSVKYNLS
jgi:hypothetical protein